MRLALEEPCLFGDAAEAIIAYLFKKDLELYCAMPRAGGNHYRDWVYVPRRGRTAQEQVGLSPGQGRADVTRWTLPEPGRGPTAVFLGVHVLLSPCQSGHASGFGET
jgi:hypothetical protein